MTEAKERACFFWDCESPIPKNHFLCSDHHEEYRNDLLDKCEECDRWKYRRYDLCRDCELRLGQSQPEYRKEHSKAWEAKDAEATEFFVYILKLDGGQFYAGQTRELRERLAEHQDGATRSTAGKNPKLVWFKVVETRGEAEEYEASLKVLCKENPREIRRWISKLKDVISLLDLS